MMRRTTWVAVILVAAIAAPAVASHRYSDVSDANPFEADIAWLGEAGITKGCDVGLFCPEDAVSRGQMAAFLHRTEAHLLDAHAANTPGALAEQLAAANLATAAYQDVATAVKAGWMDTMSTLACHENPGVGGMGVHYLNESLMDGVVDATQPEALVYELDAEGEIVGLVAHEYIVPLEAWTASEPPTLFGQSFTQHPVLPVWKLHTWIWKDNPNGTFADWNPKVRMCPEGVPVFGED